MPLARTLALALVISTSLTHAQEEPLPEEVVPVGPGYITKGWKTMVNGQVVQTTDGRMLKPAPDAAKPEPTAEPTPPASAPASAWPEEVIVLNGEIVDPANRRPVAGLPAEVELIPLGLRRLPDIDGSPGELLPFFRLNVQDLPPAPTQSAFPEPWAPTHGDDAPALKPPAEVTDAEASSNIAEATEADGNAGVNDEGGWFDFLFGEDKPEENEVVIDLNRPLSQQEMEALKRSPEFQDYLRRATTEDNRYFGRSRRGRVNTRDVNPEPPKRVVVEAFDAEEWVPEAPAPPTPNMAVGTLVSVDPARGIAVCWLHTRYLRPDRALVTRNHELQTTGVLVPSGEQDGRAAGFWVADGTPGKGDEVIVPGPDYTELVAPYER